MILARPSAWQAKWCCCIGVRWQNAGRSRNCSEAHRPIRRDDSSQGSCCFDLEEQGMIRWMANVITALLLACGAGTAIGAQQEQSIVVASTTSTQDSGLFGYLLPLVHARTGITAKVIAQGTGQALETARRGDADVVFVHDPDAEARFVAEGHGLERQLVMYNDFVIVGPAADPAAIRGMDPLRALQAIRGGRHRFVSRGDGSGTHQAELRL